MAGSFNSETISQNQQHIMRFYDDPSDFVGDVESIMKTLHGASPYNAILHLAKSGDFLAYDADIRDYLTRIGYPPTSKYSTQQTRDFYNHLMARDGSRLYDLIKSGRTPSFGPPKAKVASRNSTGGGIPSKVTREYADQYTLDRLADYAGEYIGHIRTWGISDNDEEIRGFVKELVVDETDGWWREAVIAGGSPGWKRFLEQIKELTDSDWVADRLMEMHVPGYRAKTAAAPKKKKTTASTGKGKGKTTKPTQTSKASNPAKGKGKTAKGDAAKVQSARPRRAQSMDSRKRAKQTFPAGYTAEQYQRWASNPGRYDIEGIDTPARASGNRKTSATNRNGKQPLRDAKGRFVSAKGKGATTRNNGKTTRR